MSYRRVAQLRTAEDFRSYLAELGVEIPLDETMTYGRDAPLAQPYTVHGRTLSNRFAALPMEGWDGTPDGFPTEFVRRRWTRFGESGAKLIWGAKRPPCATTGGRTRCNSSSIGRRSAKSPDSERCWLKATASILARPMTC